MKEGDDGEDPLFALVPDGEPGAALDGVHHQVPVRQDGALRDAGGAAGVLEDGGVAGRDSKLRPRVPCIVQKREMITFNSIKGHGTVKIFTEEKAVKDLLKQARAVYTKRDARVEGMTDEQLTLLCSMLVRAYDPCISCSVH